MQSMWLLKPGASSEMLMQTVRLVWAGEATGSCSLPGQVNRPDNSWRRVRDDRRQCIRLSSSIGWPRLVLSLPYNIQRISESVDASLD